MPNDRFIYNVSIVSRRGRLNGKVTFVLFEETNQMIRIKFTQLKCNRKGTRSQGEMTCIRKIFDVMEDQ